MRRSVVVFPEPDGPRSVKNSPAAISRTTPSTAATAVVALHQVLRGGCRGRARRLRGEDGRARMGQNVPSSPGKLGQTGHGPTRDPARRSTVVHLGDRCSTNRTTTEASQRWPPRPREARASSRSWPEAPSVDALQPPRGLRRGRRGARSSPAARAATSGTSTASRYLDGLSALFCVNIGHGRADVAQAGADQARELGFFTNWSYAHPRAIELAAKIASLTPGDLNRVFFTQRRQRGGRVGDQALPPVPQAHRRPEQDKLIARRHRLPRHDARRA